VSDPPSVTESATARRWVRAFLEKEVKPKLEPVMAREMKSHAGVKPWLIGTGGTTTILARMELKLDEYDRERIEAGRLPLARVRWHREHLWGMALAERKKIVGLPPKRADVILAGALIYEAVMEVFGFEELRVSMRGLRFAAMMG
jgi:exopolyphosphatase/guanosine-5'-triphosphate,3'-diphosphate pyrophosphatase